MHEMALTRSVVELVAAQTGDRTVTRVRLEVGALTAVVPDALRFCFDLACLGTPLEGADLEIHEVAGVLRCASCGATSPCPDLVRLCPCGSADVTIVAGQELRVRSVDVLEPEVVPCA